MSATWSQQVQLDEKEKPLDPSGSSLTHSPPSSAVARSGVHDAARVAYMTLPASQYSVLDAERIERVDSSTFRCYAHRVQFFSVEICPVLLVRVDEEADGCTIRLLSATLDGSPIVKSQNKKFRWSASMVNRVRWAPDPSSPASRLIMSETTLKSAVEVPVPFRMIPRDVIETAGNKLLEQILKVAVPRFLEQGTPRCFPSSPYPLTPSLLALPHLSLLSVPSSPQLKKDYEAWASGDTSRKPLGTGEL
ncbi:unnamed protein product [Closterium sp. NIES-64]|nr:unnamed protein product [Closterium sp. NIES-64]